MLNMQDQTSANKIDDPIASKLLRQIFVAQIILLPLILILMAVNLPSITWWLGLIVFLAFIGIIVWFYKRFNNHPLLQEKQSLGAQIQQAQSQLAVQEQNIQLAQDKRLSFPTLESNELKAGLQSLQKDYIRAKLKTVSIANAKITGIGPKLKITLLFHRVATAADVDSGIYAIEGFGQAKSQALLQWRDSIQAQIDQTKPTALPVEQTDAIQRKFQNHRRVNDESEQTAIKAKVELEQKEHALKVRSEELAPLTFLSYIFHAIAPNKIVAGFAISLLVIFQIGICFTTTAGVISASVPKPTHTPTVDVPALQIQAYKTAIYNVTLSAPPPTRTFTPTVTLTPAVTLTDIPVSTNTSAPTKAPIPSETAYVLPPQPTYPPGATAICNDGTYSYSQHRRGSCSGHGGVAVWLVVLPQ